MDPPTVISFCTPIPPVVFSDPVSVEVEFIVLFSVNCVLTVIELAFITFAVKVPSIFALLVTCNIFAVNTLGIYKFPEKLAVVALAVKVWLLGRFIFPDRYISLNLCNGLPKVSADGTPIGPKLGNRLEFKFPATFKSVVDKLPTLAFPVVASNVIFPVWRPCLTLKYLLAIVPNNPHCYFYFNQLHKLILNLQMYLNYSLLHIDKRFLLQYYY